MSLYLFRHAGTIYAFLFSSDIINNLMVASLQKYLRDKYGYLGLFLIVSIWGLVALTVTLFYPRNPGPEKGRHSRDKSRDNLPAVEGALPAVEEANPVAPLPLDESPAHHPPPQQRPPTNNFSKI